MDFSHTSYRQQGPGPLGYRGVFTIVILLGP